MAYQSFRKRLSRHASLCLPTGALKKNQRVRAPKSTTRLDVQLLEDRLPAGATVGLLGIGVVGTGLGFLDLGSEAPAAVAPALARAFEQTDSSAKVTTSRVIPLGGAPISDAAHVPPGLAPVTSLAPNTGGGNRGLASLVLDIGLEDMFTDPLTGESYQPRRGASTGSGSFNSSLYVAAAGLVGPAVPATGLSSSTAPGTAGATDASFSIPPFPTAPSPATAGSANTSVLAPAPPSGSGSGGAQSPALNAFAHFSGIILSPTQVDTYTLQLPAADLVVPNQQLVIGVAMRPAQASALDPGKITVTAQGTATAKSLLSTLDGAGNLATATLNTSVALVKVTPGTFTVQVGSEVKTTGAYNVDIFLAGDATDHIAVTQNDLNLIQSLSGKRLGQPGYTLEADVNRSGAIETGSRSTTDIQLATMNLGVSSPVVQFADPNLATAVRTALEIPTNRAVTRLDMLGLTSLSADSNQITSLSGLEWASNLQTLNLTPSSYAVAGALTDLSPLTNLAKLQSVTLQDAGLTNAELSTLGALPALQTLDLRYNNSLTSVSGLTGAAMLQTLHLYSTPITDLSPLAGRPISVDVQPTALEEATTVAGVAAALHNLPLGMYQYVLNNIAYQPYAGAMKGAQATLETKAGNDWDQDALLAGLLAQAGVSTQYVSGRVQVPISTVENWLGVTDPAAAGNVLLNAALNPVSIINSSNQTIAYQFDHTWLQASMLVPGAGQQWVSLDPSWKFKDYRAGVPNILGLVPFDETGYLSQVRQETAYEYYQNQVAQYLTANMPGVSVADISHDGPIHPQLITTLPTGLPYTVVGTPTINTSIPMAMEHTVQLTLQQGSTVLFQKLLVLPQSSLQRVTVGYVSAGIGSLTPELLLDGQVAASGPAVANGSQVDLFLTHFDPGYGNQTFDYTRFAGQYLGVGLDARQISPALIAREQQVVNGAAIAALDGQPFNQDDQVGAFLSLAAFKYFGNVDQAAGVVDGLAHAPEAYDLVASGVTTGGPAVTYYTDLPNPALPSGLIIDIRNLNHQSFAIDNNTANDAARRLILGDDGSAQENAIWEDLANTPSVSTIKSLQLANAQGIPIFVITSQNAATYIPQLTLPSFIVADIQARVNAGHTVTVPRDETPLGLWQGVGYKDESAGGGIAYLIFGGLVAGSVSGSASRQIDGGASDGLPNPAKKAPPDNKKTEDDDPINIANGSALRDETDINLPGIGLPLQFSRHFDADYIPDVGMGPGWIFTYGDFLTFAVSGAITWHTSEGDLVTFTPNGSGGYIVPGVVNGTFAATASGYTYRQNDGLSYDFNALGLLTDIHDRNNNALTVARNASGQITTVTESDAPERQLTFTYNGSHITAISDYTGRTCSYSYDASGRLSSATSPSDANTPAEVTQYSYYTDAVLGGLMKQRIEADGSSVTYSYYANRMAFQTSIIPEGTTGTHFYNVYRQRTIFSDQRGNPTVYDYDGDGHVTRITDPDQSNERTTWQNGRIITQTDTFGNSTTYQYDSLGNMIQKVDRAGNVYSYTYDPTFSQVTQSTEPGGRVTTFTYDANGNLLQTQDAMGEVTTMTRDGHGLLLSLTKPKGNLTPASGNYTTTYTYNDAGQILSASNALPATVSYGYDPQGRMVSSTDADGNKTTYQYDALDRLVSITDALGHSALIGYDLRNEPITTTDRLGRTQTFQYDLGARVVTTTNPDGSITTNRYDPLDNLSGVTDELGNLTQYVYDAQNRQIITILADGNSVRQAYDGGGRRVTLVDASGNATRYAYDSLDRPVQTVDALNAATAYTWDAVGNLIGTTDAIGHTNQFTYDLMNRQTKAVDANGQASTFAYDADGNLISIADPDGNITQYGYDVADRETSETNPLGATQTFVLDPVGNMVASTDRDGRSRTYSYDALNRLTAEVWLNSSDTPIRTINYSYDAAGQLIAASDPDSAYAFTYDVMGQVTSTSNAGTPSAPAVSLGYTYDAVGNRVGVADSISGQAKGLTRYAYDALNRVTQIIQTGSGVSDKRVNLTYNPDGEFASITRYGGLGATQLAAASAYSYDADNRLTALAYRGAGNQVISSFNLSYDPASRITQIADQDGTANYSYDNEGRLLTVSSTSPSIPQEGYTYDANGNRLSSGAHSGYVIGADNRLLSDGTYTYSYDNEGNLIQRTTIATGAIRLLQWDYRNRLISVTDKDSSGNVLQQVSYTYDVFNRRIAKLVTPANPSNAVQTDFVYDRDNVLLEFTQQGGPTAPANLSERYLDGPAVDQVLAQDDGSGNPHWLLSDHLGTVHDLVNNGGVVTDHLVYDSFGNVISETNPASSTRYRFAGREFDAETGLYSDRARYYDSGSGRFTRQDPFGLFVGPNPYAYANESPVNWRDPTGLTVAISQGTNGTHEGPNGTDVPTNIGPPFADQAKSAGLDLSDAVPFRSLDSLANQLANQGGANGDLIIQAHAGQRPGEDEVGVQLGDRDAGGVWLNNKTIQKPAVQEALRRIGKQVPEGHKVLLAACDLGKNKDLLQKIADLMGREVVAPKNEIGSIGIRAYINNAPATPPILDEETLQKYIQDHDLATLQKVYDDFSDSAHEPRDFAHAWPAPPANIR
jgi:RHS repeat-associated protein